MRAETLKGRNGQWTVGWAGLKEGGEVRRDKRQESEVTAAALMAGCGKE